MERCFRKSTLIKYTGDHLKSILIDGEPDYYIRDSSRIFLFEYKDIRLDASIKCCNDYSTIEREICECFIETTIDKSKGKKKKRSKPKGATQLLNVIEKKLPIILNKVDIIENKRLSIFPIIIYQDTCLDLDGVNYIVNKQFLRMKNNLDTNYYVIKDVVMINIDTLIKLEDLFSSKKINLGTCINNYIAYKQSTEFNETVSFNRYLMLYAFKKGYTTGLSKWFKDIINILKIEGL